MLCDKCKKNEATVHIKEINGGVSKTIHLCHECARRKNEDSPLNVLDGLGVNLAEVLYNIEKFAQSVKSGEGDHSEQEKTAELTCPQCRWTASRIKETGGRLGCPECYHTFHDLISDALNRIQRGTVHLGKRPGTAAPDSPARLGAELKRLQGELNKLISAEEYEAAALCRDRINALREKLASAAPKGEME